MRAKGLFVTFYNEVLNVEDDGVLKKDEESLRAQLTKKVSSSKILPEGKLIDADQAARIESAQLPGIVLVQDSLRTYPKGSYLAQVLGFTGSDNQGLAGLELQYDEILKANSGSIKIPYDAKGHPLTIYQEEYIAPGQGIDLMLTIDSQIQDVLERECSNAMIKYVTTSVGLYAFAARRGFVSVLNVVIFLSLKSIEFDNIILWGGFLSIPRASFPCPRLSVLPWKPVRYIFLRPKYF